jgi:DNA-binding MarR family transcriptional regulator
MAVQSCQLREILRLLERRLGMIDESSLSCCGITLAQCHALVEIGRSNALSLVELTAILDLDKSTTSRTVDSLVRRSLAERQTDPANRRYVVISLTSAGSKLFCRIEKEMSRYFAQVLAQIPEDKQSQVLESLQILTDAVAAIE